MPKKHARCTCGLQVAREEAVRVMEHRHACVRACMHGCMLIFLSYFYSIPSSLPSFFQSTH